MLLKIVGPVLGPKPKAAITRPAPRQGLNPFEGPPSDQIAPLGLPTRPTQSLAAKLKAEAAHVVLQKDRQERRDAIAPVLSRAHNATLGAGRPVTLKDTPSPAPRLT